MAKRKSRVNQKRQELTEADKKLLRDKERLAKLLVEEKKAVFAGTNTLLDQLRRTRKARGGVGKPLQVPGHLKDAAAGQGIIITDADLNANFQNKG